MDQHNLEAGTKRYDLDWLRIAAVLLLVPFHTARVFNVGEVLYAKSEQLSVALQRFIVFVYPWHMSPRSSSRSSPSLPSLSASPSTRSR